jgi:tetratricopeptide (TPR) repeat protein
MKTGVFITLFILLSSQLVLSAPDTTSSKKYRGRAIFFRIARGQKGVERYRIYREYHEHMSNQEFQKAIDFLTNKLSRLDSLENEYKMNTVGYMHGWRGYAHYVLMHKEAARSDVNRAIEIRPEWSSGYYYRGLIHYISGDYQAASDDYTTAINLKHKRKADIGYYYARGNAYYAQRKMEEAMADYSKCIKLKSRWAEPYIRRGSTREFREDQPGARADFEKAIALDPHNIGGYLSLGMHYYKQNDYDAAIEVVMKGLDHCDDNPNLFELAGSIYLEKGDNPQAVTYFTRFLESYSESISATIGNSAAYYDMGDKENARKYFDQARQLQPLLYNGIEGLEQMKNQCPALSKKETEVLRLMMEEFKDQ